MQVRDRRDDAAAVHVRAAEDDDLAVLRRIFRQASLSNAGDRANLLAHPEALVLADDVVHDPDTLVATLPDRQVIGFARTHESADGVLELDDMHVDPDRRRLGAARALMAEIEARARARGVRRIEVTANPHAAAFYDAMGFVPAGEAQTLFGPAPRMHLQLGDGG